MLIILKYTFLLVTNLKYKIPHLCRINAFLSVFLKVHFLLCVVQYCAQLFDVYFCIVNRSQCSVILQLSTFSILLPKICIYATVLGYSNCW